MANNHQIGHGYYLENNTLPLTVTKSMPERPAGKEKECTKAQNHRANDGTKSAMIFFGRVELKKAESGERGRISKIRNMESGMTKE